jgi:multiple sugar transport system ATP-binding protein
VAHHHGSCGLSRTSIKGTYSMASIHIRNVEKSFGDVKIIRDVSVAIADGEFVVLVGPSGCGKSTLLRMISGLETISGGEIAIGERVINNIPAKDRDIAMVFQNYALYPHMSVAQNMSFSMKMRGDSKADIEARVQKAAAILGLEALLQRHPRQLSGGQRQRVAMGRAIVRDPQVFLFDEPLSNLDAKLRVQMRAEIKELHHRLKTTMVYVTHDQIEAMTMADKIVVMRDGKVEQMGCPLELYDTPANLFVAGFIGSPGMNVMPGELVAGAQGLRFQADGGASFDLSGLPNLEAVADGQLGRRTVLGARPEHLQESASGEPARVLTVDPTGPETHVVADLGGVKVTMVSRERLRLQPGDILRLAPDARELHLFNEANGARITLAGSSVQ